VRIDSIFDSPARGGSVFIDNVMIASADRLLQNRYADIAERRSGRFGYLLAPLIQHDLFNLAQLVESLVCHDNLYVNGEFIDIWNQDIEKTVLAPLDSVVIPVIWPRSERLEAERTLATALPHFDVDKIALAELVGDSHSARSISCVKDTVIELFLPRSEAHPWGGPFNIIVGTAFYLMCSQALGVPYKPSLFRAQILADFIDREWKSRPVSASEVALALLEKSRAQVAEAYFEQLLELNVIDIAVPCILAAVLRESTSCADVLTVATQIRATPEAAAFRAWSSEFTDAIQVGDVSSVGKFMKDLKAVVRVVDASLGLERQPGLEMNIGWGPVTASRAFALPRVLHRPIYFKRHMWFLHRMYEGIASIMRITDDIQRVLFAGSPEWLLATAGQAMKVPSRPRG